MTVGRTDPAMLTDKLRRASDHVTFPPQGVAVDSFNKLLDLLNQFEKVLFLEIGFAYERPDLEKLRESYFTLRNEVLKTFNLSPEDAEPKAQDSTRSPNAP